MSRARVLTASIVGAAIAMGAVSSAGEQHGRNVDQEAIRSAFQRGEVLSLARILEVVRRAVPGEIIMVELEIRREVLVYEIMVLTETGRIREVEISARTGEVLEIEDD